MARKLSDLVDLWPAAVALAVAVGLWLVADSATRLPRLSNLALENETVPDLYIALSRNEVGRCALSGRRGATFHRGDAPELQKKWDCERIRDDAGEGEGDLWLLQSKRRGEGTALLIPAREVADWTFPFLYRFVRERDLTADLPWVGWTQLFVSRVYRGLYLRVALPFDLRKRDGGSGSLRELVTVRDARVTAVDTRFRDTVESGNMQRIENWPDLSIPSPALAWLARLRPTDGETYLVSRRDPRSRSLLPLPISLPDLYRRVRQKSPGEIFASVDNHARRVAWVSEDAEAFSASEDAALRVEFRSYADDLLRALRVDAELRNGGPIDAADLASRQRAVAGLGLSLIAQASP